jgi:UDP-N-acetylmuramate dehydrogenase
MNYELLKEFCISKSIDMRFDEPMSMHTSLKIGGSADIAFFPDESSISELLKILVSERIPFIVIGGGTNILVNDRGIGGAVIFTSKMNNITLNAEHSTLNAEAGCSLQKVINLCIEHGLSGTEGLAGIPGSIGGAIAGNAGSFGCEIKDVVKSVNLLMPDGDIRELSASDMSFKYRSTKIPSDSIILSAVLFLKKDEPSEIKKRFTGFINEKKSKQPVSKPSAGCVFKNPKDIAAGKLIDDAGCKGMRVGDIEVSSMHANFFINTGKGTADDFLKLMDMVGKKVKDKFGIVLEPEIRIIGR